MDDAAVVQSENENLRKVRTRLLQWESSSDALAPLNALQLECLDLINNQCRNYNEVPPETISSAGSAEPSTAADNQKNSTSLTGSASAIELQRLPSPGINNTKDFLLWYDRVKEEIICHADVQYSQYLQQLEQRDAECVEVDKYLSEPVLQRKDSSGKPNDPLVWWHQRKIFIPDCTSLSKNDCVFPQNLFLVNVYFRTLDNLLAKNARA